MTAATSSGSPGISDAAAAATVEPLHRARVPATRPAPEEDEETIPVGLRQQEERN
jgi:hypothetical protein